MYVYQVWELAWQHSGLILSLLYQLAGVLHHLTHLPNDARQQTTCETDSASTEWLLLPLMTHVSASSLWSYHLLRCPRLCPVERHSFTHFFNRAHAHTRARARGGHRNYSALQESIYSSCSPQSISTSELCHCIQEDFCSLKSSGPDMSG